MTSDRPGYSLVHPVYLDVPMMISFLAHLEGGVSAHEEETKRATDARERALKGRAGIRLRFAPVGDADVGADGSTQRRDENAIESKSERHHTAASLFNLLYEYLKEDDQLIYLEDPAQLAVLSRGQLVEVAGEYLGNPLEEVLALMGTFMPYVAEQEEAQLAAAKNAIERDRKSQRSGNPAKRATGQANQKQTLLENALQNASNMEAQLSQRLFRRMNEDLKQVPVHDLLMTTDGGLQVVLTASSEYYSATTNEYLRAGEFRAVGKVTRVITGDRTINLTRRTLLGAAGPAIAQNMMASLNDNEEMEIEVADPIVSVLNACVVEVSGWRGGGEGVWMVRGGGVGVSGRVGVRVRERSVLDP